MIFLEKLKKLDKATLFIIICLNAIGTVAVYGATVGTKLEGLHKNSMLLIALSMILMLLAASFDYRVIFGKLRYILYAFGIGMLAFVQFKGENINGAVVKHRIVSAAAFGTCQNIYDTACRLHAEQEAGEEASSDTGRGADLPGLYAPGAVYYQAA